MRISSVLAAAIVGGATVWAIAQTPSSTQPVQPADKMLDDMLKPQGNGGARPLQPITGAPAIDQSTGGSAVAPGAPSIAVLREGSYIVDRVGRLARASDGQGWEFVFEADGRALKDPPLRILPNLKLMLMEDQLKDTRRDLKFRVTGLITEYRGRNHVLMEKVVVLSE
ncbi:MAG TPA: hypothetical protein VGB55_02600 [Tepidisphaeraceae bacterium]|jgi:hypothetical protein